MTHFRIPFGLLLFVGICIACGGPQAATNPNGASEPASSENTIVARYADTTITLAQLDSAYAESVGGRARAADSSLRAYRQFLDQYLNFRLKVRAAREARMDTLQSIQRDIRNYRQKMARPRLLRREVYEPLARTLYKRQTREVDVSHILIRTENRDSLAARRLLEEIADSLDQGISFSKLAFRNSEDPSARKRGGRGYQGHLGYLGAGDVIKPFEKRMYNLDPGQVSDIFRTKYGYHLIKVHDIRAAKPPVRLSHILRQPGKDSAATRRFLDSLRTAIINDSTTFAAAARAHSQDGRSAAKGGDLGKGDPRSLPESFRNAVASLDSVGAVSGVVETRHGLHLIKLNGRDEQKSFEQAYEELKKKLRGRPRTKRRKNAFAQEIRLKHGVTVDTARILETSGIASADSLARPLLSRLDRSAPGAPSVATLGDSTYTLDQMAHHLTQMDGGAQTTVRELIDSFLNEKAIQYAATRFARRNPSLATEMRKYREGVLLFQYMQDSVWTAAAQDTSGLRATYRQNRDQYRFPERVRTIVLRAPSDSLLQPHEQAYRETRSLSATVERAASDSLVSVDTVFVTQQSADVYQAIWSLSDGQLTGPVDQQNASLLMIRDTKLPPRRKTFEEARSSVVQEYQNTYEEQVLRRLRERYNAKMYPERLRPPFGGSISSQ